MVRETRTLCLLVAPAISLLLASAAHAMTPIAPIGDLAVTRRANLRTGPGVMHAVTLTLEAGVRVVALDTSGGWTRVRIPDGKRGWVNTPLLERVPQTPVVAPAGAPAGSEAPSSAVSRSPLAPPFPDARSAPRHPEDAAWEPGPLLTPARAQTHRSWILWILAVGCAALAAACWYLLKRMRGVLHNYEESREIVGIEQRRDRLRDEVRTLRQTVRDRDATIQVSERRLAEVAQRLQTMERDHTVQSEALHHSLARLEQQAHSLARSNRTLSDSLGTLHHDKLILQQELRTLQSVHDAALAEHRRATDALRRERDSLGTHAEQAQATIAELTAANEQLQGSSAEMQDQQSLVEAQWRERMEALAREVERLRDELQFHRLQLRDAQLTVAERDHALADARRHAEQLTKQAGQTAHAHAVIRESLEAQVALARGHVAALQEELRGLQQPAGSASAAGESTALPDDAAPAPWDDGRDGTLPDSTGVTIGDPADTAAYRPIPHRPPYGPHPGSTSRLSEATIHGGPGIGRS